MLSDNHSNNCEFLSFPSAYLSLLISSSADKSQSNSCSNPASPQADLLTTSILEDPFDSEWVSSLIFNPSPLLSGEKPALNGDSISSSSSAATNNNATSTSPFQSLSLDADVAGQKQQLSTNPFVDSLSHTVLSPQIDSHDSLLASSSTKQPQMIPVFEVNL